MTMTNWSTLVLEAFLVFLSLLMKVGTVMDFLAHILCVSVSSHSSFEWIFLRNLWIPLPFCCVYPFLASRVLSGFVVPSPWKLKRYLVCVAYSSLLSPMDTLKPAPTGSELGHDITGMGASLEGLVCFIFRLITIIVYLW